MISQLKGQLIEKNAPAIIIDVHGVGYEVLVPMSSYVELPECGQPLSIFTQLIVREDSQTLYGFLTKRDRSLFLSLLKVNGVGAKMALGVLSAMDADTFVIHVQQKQVSQLIKLPGVGKKTAERLVIELHDRLKDWQSSATAELHQEQQQHDEIADTAMEALQALGYRSAEANKMITAALKQQQYANSEALIRAALRSSTR